MMQHGNDVARAMDKDMRIYLIRHAADEPGFRGGWSQRGLSQLGWDQARKLAARIAAEQQGWKISTIVSSDLPKAMETAEGIGEAVGVEPAYSQAWREINNGDLAGMANKAAMERYPRLYFNSLEMDERYPKGESPRELLKRVKLAWAVLTDDVAAGELESNVAVVTHGGVISVLYHILLKVEWSNKNRMFPADNTSVHTVELHDGCWDLARRNDTEHLEADDLSEQGP